MQWTLLFPFLVMLLWGSKSYPLTHHPVTFSLLTTVATRDHFKFNLQSSNNMNKDDPYTSLPVILRVQYCGG